MSIETEIKYITSKKFFLKYYIIFIVILFFSSIISLYKYNKQSEIYLNRYVLKINEQIINAQNIYNFLATYIRVASLQSQEKIKTEYKNFLVNPYPKPGHAPTSMEFYIMYSSNDDLEKQKAILDKILILAKKNVNSEIEALEKEKIDLKMSKNLHDKLLKHVNNNFQSVFKDIENNNNEAQYKKFVKEVSDQVKIELKEKIEDLENIKNIFSEFDKKIDNNINLDNLNNIEEKPCEQFLLKVEFARCIKRYYDNFIIIKTKKALNDVIYSENNPFYFFMLTNSYTTFQLESIREILKVITQTSLTNNIEKLKKLKAHEDEMQIIFNTTKGNWAIVLADTKIIKKNIYHFITTYFFFSLLLSYILAIIFYYKEKLFKKY